MIDQNLDQRPILSTSWRTLPGKLITTKRQIQTNIQSNDFTDEQNLISYLNMNL